MPDYREDPHMSSLLFSTPAIDDAITDIGALTNNITARISVLEELQEPALEPAIRMLLAGEAALEHAAGRLQHARETLGAAWSERQQAARTFLEVRVTQTGRTWRLERDRDSDGKRYTGVPPAGAIFRFTLQRVSVASGAHQNDRRGERVHFDAVGPGTITTDFYAAPLQVLHRAFLEGAIVEMSDQVELLTPAEIARVRERLEGEIGPLHFIGLTEDAHPHLRIVWKPGIAWTDAAAERARVITLEVIGARPIVPLFSTAGPAAGVSSAEAEHV